MFEMIFHQNVREFGITNAIMYLILLKTKR